MAKQILFSLREKTGGSSHCQWHAVQCQWGVIPPLYIYSVERNFGTLHFYWIGVLLPKSPFINTGYPSIRIAVTMATRSPRPNFVITLLLRTLLLSKPSLAGPCAGGFFCPVGQNISSPCTCPAACMSTDNIVDPIDSLVWTTKTLAGTGVAGYLDAAGTNAVFINPFGNCRLASVVNSTIYISDQGSNRMRAVNPAGVVTTVVGTGAVGVINGIGTSASLQAPQSCVVEPGSARLWVVAANQVRAIALPSYATSTLAGSTIGTAGYADGIGTNALFSSPSGIGLSSTGTLLYIADYNTHRIRSIDIFSAAVATVAGSGVAAWLDGQGTVASFNNPWALVVGQGGNIFVADKGNNRIRRVSPSGMVSTLSGSDGPSWTDAVIGGGATFSQPVGIAAAMSGTLFVVDFAGGHRVRLVAPDSGATYTIGGTGNVGFVNGVGIAASFSSPIGIAVDLAGSAIVSDNGNKVVRQLTCAPCPAGNGCKFGIPSPCDAGTWSGGGLAQCAPCTAVPGYG